MRRNSDMERKKELFHYHFLMYIGKMTWKFTVGLLEPRNLKLIANRVVTDQGKATLNCLAKWEEAGITLSSFLTLKSSDVTTGRNQGPSDPGLLFYASESEIQEKFDDLSYLSEWVIITQSCLTVCNPMDYSLPGSSVHGILQARESSHSFSNGSSQHRDRAQFSCTAGRFFTVWVTREAPGIIPLAGRMLVLCPLSGLPHNEPETACACQGLSPDWAVVSTL